MDLRPFWPPAEPERRMRRRPVGRATSSQTTRISAGSRRKNRATALTETPLRFM